MNIKKKSIVRLLLYIKPYWYLILISTVFGVSLDYIMLRCENRKSTPTDIDTTEMEILAELQNFSSAEKERLLKHLELDNALKLNNIG